MDAKPNEVEGQEDFLTEPLTGLEPKPRHLMTEAELREYVVEVHNLRQSFQSFKANVEARAESKSPKAKKAKVEDKAALSKLLEEF